MSDRRVLITGGTGLLAVNWACAVRDRWQVILATHGHQVELAGVTSCRLDLTDPQRLARQFGGLAPELIVHAAGLTNVDRCEQFPVSAKHANAEIARTVAIAAAEQNIDLIHVSTDHLFSGTSSLQREGALPQPLNEYARSKWLAEQWVLQSCPNAIILRTNFFGWGTARRQSFSDWIVNHLRAGVPVSLFEDVYYTPILASSLANAAHELSRRGATGIFNLVGEERLSKYEFGVRLARGFSLPLELIRRERLANARLYARRPHDMSLDNTKTRMALGRNLGTVAEYLAELRTQEVQGRKRELLESVSESIAEPIK